LLPWRPESGAAMPKVSNLLYESGYIQVWSLWKCSAGD
jgi:hypothetical protein